MHIRLIVRLTAVLVFILLAGAGTLYVFASTGPVPAESGLFGLQAAAEQSWLNLQFKPFDRMVYSLNLLDRRTRDLITSIGHPSEAATLFEADRSLNRVLSVISDLSVEERQAAAARVNARPATPSPGSPGRALNLSIPASPNVPAVTKVAARPIITRVTAWPVTPNPASPGRALNLSIPGSPNVPAAMKAAARPITTRVTAPPAIPSPASPGPGQRWFIPASPNVPAATKAAVRPITIRATAWPATPSPGSPGRAPR